MSPVAALKRSTRSAVLLLIAAFLLGGVAGGAAVAFGLRPGGREGPHGHDPERFQRKLPCYRAKNPEFLCQKTRGNQTKGL